MATLIRLKFQTIRVPNDQRVKEILFYRFILLRVDGTDLKTILLVLES